MLIDSDEIEANHEGEVKDHLKNQVGAVSEDRFTMRGYLARGQSSARSAKCLVSVRLV